MVTDLGPVSTLTDNLAFPEDPRWHKGIHQAICGCGRGSPPQGLFSVSSYLRPPPLIAIERSPGREIADRDGAIATRAAQRLDDRRPGSGVVGTRLRSVQKARCPDEYAAEHHHHRQPRVRHPVVHRRHQAGLRAVSADQRKQPDQQPRGQQHYRPPAPHYPDARRADQS